MAENKNRDELMTGCFLQALRSQLQVEEGSPAKRTRSSKGKCIVKDGAVYFGTEPIGRVLPAFLAAVDTLTEEVGGQSVLGAILVDLRAFLEGSWTKRSSQQVHRQNRGKTLGPRQFVTIKHPSGRQPPGPTMYTDKRSAHLGRTSRVVTPGRLAQAVRKQALQLIASQLS